MNKGLAVAQKFDPEFLKAVRAELDTVITQERLRLAPNSDAIRAVFEDAVTEALGWNEGNSAGAEKGWETRRANDWKPTAKEYARALRQGRAAMERVIARKQDEIAAIERPGLGKVDFRYGGPGTPPQFGDGSGVAKIIAKRDYEAKTNPEFAGQSGKNVARGMVETLLRGKVGVPYQSGQKVNIEWKHFTATLRRDFNGEGNPWLLTGFITQGKGRMSAR